MSDDDDFMQDSGEEEYVSIAVLLHYLELTAVQIRLRI